MNGRYVGYVAGDDPLHGFLSRIIRDLMGVREAQPAFRAFRLSGSNVVYAYQEKFSHVKIICKFYGPRFGPDLDKAAGKARQEYEGLDAAPVQPDRVAAPRDPPARFQPRHQRGAGR